jgi:hypothetical protein
MKYGHHNNQINILFNSIKITKIKHIKMITPEDTKSRLFIQPDLEVDAQIIEIYEIKLATITTDKK